MGHLKCKRWKNFRTSGKMSEGILKIMKKIGENIRNILRKFWRNQKEMMNVEGTAKLIERLS